MFDIIFIRSCTYILWAWTYIWDLGLVVGCNACRSEGIPLRDISSLGAMDWGLARLENSSVAAAAAVVALWMEGDDL